jgi:Transposase
MTNNKQEVMEVLTGPERRRRWSADEKLTMVRESFEPSKTVSMVARQHGVNPNQLIPLAQAVPGWQLVRCEQGCNTFTLAPNQPGRVRRAHTLRDSSAGQMIVWTMSRSRLRHEARMPRRMGYGTASV